MIIKLMDKTVYFAQHNNTAHIRHKGNVQPIQYTDCTIGQAHCTVVEMEVAQSNQILKIKLSTTI
jgi:hypothetical protein